jgi:hypothetical protein
MRFTAMTIIGVAGLALSVVRWQPRVTVATASPEPTTGVTYFIRQYQCFTDIAK